MFLIKSKNIPKSKSITEGQMISLPKKKAKKIVYKKKKTIQKNKDYTT